MQNKDITTLEEFGFSFKKAGIHTRRTMMLNELKTLFEYVNNINANKEDYYKAIIEENCLGKRSGSNRKYSASYLSELYLLDPNILLFKAFIFFWSRDPESRPQIALLLSYVRDGVLKDSADYIMKLPVGAKAVKRDLEEHMSNKNPNRFSVPVLQSTVRNLLSTWSQSGHLIGRTNKERVRIEPKIGAIAFAAFLSYLCGERGQLLFETEYFKLLDCSQGKAIELIKIASNKGWLVFKQLKDVVEIAFPNLSISKL